MTPNKKLLMTLILSSLCTGSLAIFAAEQPSFFDWRLTTPTDRTSAVTDSIVPAIRDQGRHGTCWTFGALGSYETNWNVQLRQAGNTTASAPQFSSRYMNWLTYASALNNDPATLIHFEPVNGNDYPYPENIYEVGGSRPTAMAALARYGAVLESQSPYSLASGSMGGVEQVISPSGLLHDALHYPNWQDPSNYLHNNLDYYKKLIATYGALAIGYSAESSKVKITSRGNEIYNTTKTNTNHAVCLVGWDDDYVFNNFTNADGTALKGAWILRNSWGDKAGTGGYYYMSYQDTSASSAYMFIPELDSVRYTQVNTLAPLGVWSLLTFKSKPYSFAVANKLTASASQMLKAVSVYVPNDAMSYQVSVRLKGSSPTDGNEVYTQKGTFGADGLAVYSGYRTIDLKKFVYLPNKENYVVTVTLTDNNNHSIPLPVSYVDGTYIINQPVASNSSFLFDPDSNTWIDTKDIFLDEGITDTTVIINGLSKDSNLANGGDFTVVSLNDNGTGGSSIYLGKANELYATDILHPDRKTLSNMTVELTKGVSDSWYGGVISGEGQVIKTGSGMLALSGANTYTGATSVNAGSLALTGSLQSPVTVASGATLTGTGTINGNLNNAGTLVPGLTADAQNLLGTTNTATTTSVGTLTVDGNFNSSGNLQIALNGKDNSKLAVSGASTLTGTTIALTDGSTRPIANYHYTYLTSPGGITGNGTVNNGTLSPYLTLTSVISSTRGNLIAQETTPLGTLPGMSASEGSVGRAISSRLATAAAADPTSANSQALNDLFYQDEAASRTTMKQITSSDRAQLLTVSPLTAMTTGAVHDRLDTALFDGNVNVTVPTASFDSVPGTMQVAAPVTLDTENNLWFKLLRGFEAYGGIDGGYDLHNKSFGGVIGYDKAVNDTTRIGGLFSYAKTDYNTDVMSGDSHDWRIGIYGSHDNGTWKTQGLLSYGQNRYDFNRYISYDGSKLSSDYTAKVFDMDVRTKYLPQNNRAKSWQVAPYIGLSYTHTSQGSYEESGGLFAQSMDSASNNSWRAEGGVEWKHNMDKTSSWGGSVGYKRVLSGANPELNGIFAGDDNRFTLKSDNDKDYFTYSMNISKNTGHDWTVQGEIRGEKSAHNHSEVYSLMAKHAF